MPAADAVPMLSVTSVFLNLMVLAGSRRSLSIMRILPLLIAGVAGLLPGIWLLKTVDESVLKVLIGGMVTISSLIFISGFRIRVRRERLAMVPVGLVSGVLNGATTFSGPPVILFFANQEVARHRFRAGLAAYFLLLNIAAVPAFIAGGLLTGEVALRTALLFPATAAGALLGVWFADRVSDTRFRTLALSALTMLGVFSVVSGL